jgi:hypothetical protein
VTRSRDHPVAASFALGVVALVVTIAVAACSAGGPPEASPSGTPTATSRGASSDGGGSAPRSPVAGVITSVDSQGLDKVKGFTLRTNGGLTLTFVLGKLDNPTEFPPGHLAEHQASSAPVFVWFKEENGNLVVYHLEDA